MKPLLLTLLILLSATSWATDKHPSQDPELTKFLAKGFRDQAAPNGDAFIDSSITDNQLAVFGVLNQAQKKVTDKACVDDLNKPRPEFVGLLLQLNSKGHIISTQSFPSAKMAACLKAEIQRLKFLPPPKAPFHFPLVLGVAPKAKK